MDEYFVEVRAWKARCGSPRFVALAALDRYVGFRSVYAFDADKVETIKKARSTANLQGVPVYADQLLLDFDDVDPSSLLLFLYDEGIAHTVYNSGGRSTHVHINTEAMYGEHVPRSHKRWVEAHAPTADTAFYHPAGMYRLANTLHERTGLRKEVIREHQGKRLLIPAVASPAPPTAAVTGERSDELYPLLLRTKHDGGGRKSYAWSLAKIAHRNGMSREEAHAAITWWNERNCKPSLEREIIEGKVSDVYGRRAPRA